MANQNAQGVERINMDLNLAKYYEARLDMMASQGWIDLMEDVAKMIQATDSLSGVTVDNLQFKQGELSIMRWLSSLEDISETAYESLKGEQP